MSSGGSGTSAAGLNISLGTLSNGSNSVSWNSALASIVQQECSWNNAAAAQAILIVARNWAYIFSNSEINGSDSEVAKKILTWGHGLTVDNLVSKGDSVANEPLSFSQGESVSGTKGDFVSAILSGKHYTYIENAVNENLDGAQYYNNYGAADIEDLTGFPGSNTSYQSRWVVKVPYLGNRFVNWTFVSSKANNFTKPSELLGLQ